MGLVTRQFVRDWSIHNDMPVGQNAELRRATVTRSARRVNSDGQNLIAVLHTLYTNDRAFEEFLDKAMSAAFPDDYDKLIFPPAEHGRTEMRVRRKHRKGTDSPADLSDGTLRFLLLATILGSTDPAPLIAIDEPEAGLHPRMMSIVAEIAANAATKSQVIFSTHSPEFLDAFRPEPPTVTVVTSNGSETELRTVGGDDLKKWVQDYSLGKFAFSGEAEAVL
jgi:predicted ATPase